MNLVPVTQRAYIASHPLALSFAIGVFATGLISILFPHFFEETSVSLALPDWLRMAFRGTWTIGGALSTFGILRGRRHLEASGMILLASGLAVNYLSIISIRPEAALSGIFIATLAVGCAFRARHLTNGGYDVIEIRRSH